MSTEGDQENRVGENHFDRLREQLASGEVSVLSVFEFGSSKWRTQHDHEAYVMYSRATQMLMSDVRILKRLMVELDAEFERRAGKRIDHPSINAAVKSKDGARRVAKLNQFHAEAYRDGASLIVASTFAEALEQYLALVAHVERLWDDACKLYRERHYPLSTFLSILTVEEVGKLGRLWNDLLAWDSPASSNPTLGLLGRDHRKKHFMAVMAGAVVNARLDRILGLKEVRKLLQDVESGKLEQLRQSCLYIDVVDGKVVKPEDVVDCSTARFFVVLAGELWAETLGHFPWEFQRMIDKVTEFEIEVGIDPALIERS
ncbi:AbiV family abortive infection protein [Bradyrhizobium sp. Pear77]|uniref:AbiV family abortive infection protein n=1 Tax=Bradyrhizobium altum TaxID=1571202 RepID=UPI001E43CB26|nr:AbiV family abortive infection protein [Bradyrhizobium altum]MCC8959303.1 AbiV family abortive infection protein [Bradyrhizobium altum]